jgi:thiamine kinase-like enzyme
MRLTRTNAGAHCDLHQAIRGPLEEWHERGAAELSEVLDGLLGDETPPDGRISIERLKRAVYRLRIGGRSGRSLVLKRHSPTLAETDRLVVERWLPAIGFGDRCPRLLAAAADREGSCVWHLYEDLGTENLAVQRDPARLAAAVDCLAELHTSGALHPILPEVRWRARDHGTHFFTESLRDAIALLDRLPTDRLDRAQDLASARTRLRDRLSRLLDDAPRWIRIAEGIPDTLLHGDLWPKNVFFTAGDWSPRAQLIDWDHVGAGPFTYDLSTFLYQCSIDERPWILQRYRAAVEGTGWRLPDDTELNILFHTAEIARYAHCILWAAMALVNDGADWGIGDLIDYDGWFEMLRPPLPE